MIFTCKCVDFSIGERKTNRSHLMRIQMDGALQLFQEAILHSIGAKRTNMIRPQSWTESRVGRGRRLGITCTVCTSIRTSNFRTFHNFGW